jgi:hypothetical protein
VGHGRPTCLHEVLNCDSTNEYDKTVSMIGREKKDVITASESDMVLRHLKDQGALFGSLVSTGLTTIKAISLFLCFTAVQTCFLRKPRQSDISRCILTCPQRIYVLFMG